MNNKNINKNKNINNNDDDDGELRGQLDAALEAVTMKNNNEIYEIIIIVKEKL